MSSVVLWTGSACAGPEPARDGFFIGFGVGGGSATPDSDLDGESGGTGAFRIGYAPKDDVTLGLEAGAWTKDVGGATWTFSVATLGVTYYPGNNGFYLKGGLGLGSIEVEILGITGSESGFGILGGLGYEARLTEKFALGGEARIHGISTDTFDSARFGSLNLMFNWYWSEA